MNRKQWLALCGGVVAALVLPGVIPGVMRSSRPETVESRSIRDTSGQVTGIVYGPETHGTIRINLIGMALVIVSIASLTALAIWWLRSNDRGVT